MIENFVVENFKGKTIFHLANFILYFLNINFVNIFYFNVGFWWFLKDFLNTFNFRLFVDNSVYITNHFF